ncbi:MAG TPA: DUF1549 domain-containing protein, partial [Bryobacteraceae bacterium]|nr:DUF1549 domain-containing protein [Bryobacteraceae bacterium]
MGALRLDSKAVASKSIVPGKSAESSLYQRVAGLGDQARMPMGGKPLSASEVATIKAWIDAGAEWPEKQAGQNAEIRKHWAFSAPVRPSLPALKIQPKPANPIDGFVLAKLEKEGLRPSSRADKVTLLRRLSLDLTGLPPSIEEVDAFLADASPGAYAKQVDRLLRSPHYGERWGRIWLDAARYADSDGFEKDKSRQVWFYRDWVVNALNTDMPYDRFVIEQIAGDLLPGATQSQRVATGFLRNSMINEEGGIDPEQFRMEAMYDRMDAIGKSILGVTIQCAQCHNHKFDPIAQEEYYKLFAFLNNAHEANIAVYTPEEERKRQDILAKIAAIEKRKPRPAPQADKVNWTVVRPEVDDISTGGQRYLPMEDGSLLAAGYAPTKHRAQLTAKTDLAQIRAVRLELMNDPNLPLGGPGRSIKGTGVLSDFEIEAVPANDPKAKPVKVKISGASADVEVAETPLDPIFDDKSGNKRTTGPIAFAIDGNENTGWSHDPGPVLRNRPRIAVFNLEEPVSFTGGTILHFYLKQRHGGWNSDDNQNNNLGRFRLSITSDEGAKAPAPDALDSEVAKLWAEHPEGSTQLVLEERRQPRSTHVLARGDYLQPGK